MKHVLVVAAIILSFRQGKTADCQPCVSLKSVPSGFTKKTFEENNDHIENPGRGFLSQEISYASHPQVAGSNYLGSVRKKTGVNMVWIYFVLDKFVKSHIDNDYLRNVEENLENVMDAGFTATIRFCYTFKRQPRAPYGDANKYWILEHIKQLKPVFNKYEGVLTSVEAGFIGTWGEWFYTTHFGDPLTTDYNKYPKFGYPESLWQDRREVFTALLRAVPKSLQVQIRYPIMKVDMWNDSTPTTYADVLKQNDKARTGHHNDCFLASDNDVGTYQDKTTQYPYLHKDTEYSIVGGETCTPRSTSDRYQCPSALKEMAMFHWTFLNQGFSADILNTWKREGCYEEIHRRLGYRFSLRQAVLPNSVQRGGILCFDFNVKNSGFAAPVKEMNVFLILRSEQGGHFYAGKISTDVRNWRAGTTVDVQGSIHVPASIPEGRYDTYLAIGDKILSDKSDYFILLANKNVPVYSAGYNNLHHSIMVSGHHSDIGTSCPDLHQWTPPAPSKHSRVFHGSLSNIIG